jgi:branched-chain amino acid transport system ATP-binding protein
MSDRATTELVLEDIVAGYGGTTVLDGVSLTLGQGERVGIIGRNGAGKTTTLATAMGLTQRLGGRVRLNGRDVSAWPAWQRARLGLGYVPQTRDVFASLSVEDNLVAGLKGGPASRLDEAYALFPRLAERRRNFGNELSGGEQQMLSIARALMGKPSILLLDEPLEGLSPIVAQEVMAAVTTLAHTRGLACVLVEQQVELVLDFAQRVLVLERGRPVFWGEVAQLRQRRDVLEAAVALRKPVASAAR